MSVFGPLREFLKALFDPDEPTTPAPEKKREAKPVQRAQSSHGDGFDGSRGRRVDLRGGLKVPVLEVEQDPQPPSAVVSSDFNFNASLDDLPVLLDAPLEEQPEFIPAGGMSTESLMREFETLDPSAVVMTESESLDQLRRTAADPNAERPAPFVVQRALTEVVAEVTPELAPVEVVPADAVRASTASLMQEFETLDPAAVLAASTAEDPNGEPPAALVVPSASTSADAPAFTPLPAIDTAEFATPESTFAFEAPSLAESSFESSSPPSEGAPEFDEPSAEEPSFEESSFTPAPPSSVPPTSKPERMVPSWLVPATTAPMKRAESPSGPEFSASLDDLALLAPEPAAPESQPSSQPSPPQGEGGSGGGENSS